MQSRNDRLSQSPDIFLAYSPGLHPSSYKKLFWRLLNESTQEHLFKFSLSYFNNYILKGGDREHPILGDLRYFISQAETIWDQKNPNEIGNPVITLLKSKFSLDLEIDRLYVNALTNALQSPAKAGLKHFTEFFQLNGVQRKHPVLGDLLVFASNIEKHWDAKAGNNLVAQFLRGKLAPSSIQTPTFNLCM